ncbi:hypothetical protein NQ317_007557 [Molorchus minor]|uniref:Nose resistant-to-fluoxetine protein N-terminal domain-containing protein n=1 Tax=Molorchus minor TaxID=1323400 RepID=A0ABQ9K523_9CUCU|nr:hypothetical protein NQ317_007557 [Molorchus minor]
MNLFILLLVFLGVKCDLNTDQFEKYSTVLRSEYVCRNTKVVIDGVSEKCAEQLGIVCSNGSLLMTMLDASGKFPYAGLGYASRYEYGNFEQCMSIKYPYEGGKILGEYCTGGLIIPDLKNMSDSSLYFAIATCKPNGCSADDYNSITKSIYADFPPLFQDLYCQTAEHGTEYTAMDIVTITIFAVVILLMIASTLYDIYLYLVELRPAHPLYVCFSVLTNGRKLLHISKGNKEEINCFYGLRVISMAWIIAGHGLAGMQYANVSNANDVLTYTTKRYTGYLTAANLAVDTFFFMSGFLVAYQYLKNLSKSLRNHLSSIPNAMAYRYFRLTPAVLMLYLASSSILTHLGSGPLWVPTVEDIGTVCRRRWWPFFLYIQNYYNYNDLCLIPTWFLSTNMQMYLIAPFIIVPVALFIKSQSGFKWAMLELTLVNVFCIGFPLVINLSFRNYDNEYGTHTSLIDFSIGVMLAAFIRAKPDAQFLHFIKRHNIPVINLLTWVLTVLGMVAVVFCYQEMKYNDHNYVSRSVFYCLMRPAWCIGLCWIVYSCYHGHGGFINWILCRPIFQILGRLTYCMYLLHHPVQLYALGTVSTRTYFNDYNICILFCGHYVVTLIASVFWTLAFESPTIVIEKTISGRASSQKNDQSFKNGNSGNHSEVKGA